MQQYAGVHLLQNYSTCFGCLTHPSSGVHQTVTAASCTGYSVRLYNLYQTPQLQFDVLLMIGTVDTRNI